VAGNDGSQHFDGEEPELTEQQQAAIDQIREILDTLPPDRRQVFQDHLKGLIHGEKGSEEKCGDFSEAENRRQPDDAGSDHSGDRG
jgi:hypothetical protein